MDIYEMQDINYDTIMAFNNNLSDVIMAAVNNGNASKKFIKPLKGLLKATAKASKLSNRDTGRRFWQLKKAHEKYNSCLRKLLEIEGKTYIEEAAKKTLGVDQLFVGQFVIHLNNQFGTAFLPKGKSEIIAQTEAENTKTR